MKPRITVITIGVDDLQRALRFAVMAQAQAAGATIVKPAHDHLWEIVWNPQWMNPD